MAALHCSRCHAAAKLQQAILREEHSPLLLALERARAAARRLSVTIDGRALVSSVGGTQTYLIGLILALAQSGVVALRVLTPPDLSERAATAFAGLSHVELISYEQALREPRKTDVVHRPQQVFTHDDFELLRLLGERLVIGHQDLIAYHDEAYHRDVAAAGGLSPHDAVDARPRSIGSSSSPSTRGATRSQRVSSRRRARASPGSAQRTSGTRRGSRSRLRVRSTTGCRSCCA